MAGASVDDIAGYLTDDTIDLYIGPKSKRYSVHRGLLTQYQWFRNRIRGFASLCHMTLLTEDPKVFELLISWLYRKKLNAISIAYDEVAKKKATLYVDLYLRASEWEMRELQNALMDRLRARKTCVYGFFPRQLIGRIYENTESESPLRSYIVDSFIHKGIGWNEDAELMEHTDGSVFILTRKRALERQLDAGNQDFVLDCYEALFQLCAKSKIRDPDQNRKKGCVYHVHEEGEKCRSS